jgi:hypothetical protein
MFRVMAKVFVRFASVALVATIVQVSLISVPLAQQPANQWLPLPRAPYPWPEVSTQPTDQGKCGPAKHALDSAPDSRVTGAGTHTATACRLDPRWEPYAGKPHVRFCAGGAR